MERHCHSLVNTDNPSPSPLACGTGMTQPSHRCFDCTSHICFKQQQALLSSISLGRAGRQVLLLPLHPLPATRFVANCLYTLHKYGKQPHFIVAVFDPVSLAECKRLNLPCFNAEGFSGQRIEDGDHGFGSRHAVAMW